MASSEAAVPEEEDRLSLLRPASLSPEAGDRHSGVQRTAPVSLEKSLYTFSTGPDDNLDCTEQNSLFCKSRALFKKKKTAINNNEIHKFERSETSKLCCGVQYANFSPQGVN